MMRLGGITTQVSEFFHFPAGQDEKCGDKD